MAARLASGVWVSAYLARLAQEGIHAHLIHRGEPTAGAVVVKVAFMDGRASLYQRAYGPEGRRIWDARFEAAPEGEVDEAIARLRRRDPDLWVIEVEDPRGRHMLDSPGFEE